MHITVHVKAHYDYVPAPPGVVPSNSDVELGKARKTKDGSAWLMRVRRTAPNQHSFIVPECEIQKHAIAVSMPYHEDRKIARGVQFNRVEAVLDYLSKPIALATHFDQQDIVKFEVHDDSGLKEAEFRALLAQYVGIACGRTGKPLATLESVETFVKKYLEPADVAAHEAALHSKYVVEVTP